MASSEQFRLNSILTEQKQIADLPDENHAKIVVQRYYEAKNGRKVSDDEVEAIRVNSFGESASFSSALTQLRSTHDIDITDAQPGMMRNKKGRTSVGDFLRVLSASSVDTAYGSQSANLRMIEGLAQDYYDHQEKTTGKRQKRGVQDFIGAWADNIDERKEFLKTTMTSDEFFKDSVSDQAKNNILANGIGQMLFVIPTIYAGSIAGAGIGAGIGKTAIGSAKIAKGVGLATSLNVTSGMLYGEAYNESIAFGHDTREAHDVARLYTLAFAPIGVLSDALTMGMIKPLSSQISTIGSKAVRGLAQTAVQGALATVTEGAEEGFEYLGLNALIGKKATPAEFWFSVKAGALIGAIGGVAMNGASSIDSARGYRGIYDTLVQVTDKETATKLADTIAYGEGEERTAAVEEYKTIVNQSVLEKAKEIVGELNAQKLIEKLKNAKTKQDVESAYTETLQQSIEDLVGEAEQRKNENAPSKMTEEQNSDSLTAADNDAPMVTIIPENKEILAALDPDDAKRIGEMYSDAEIDTFFEGSDPEMKALFKKMLRGDKTALVEYNRRIYAEQAKRESETVVEPVVAPVPAAEQAHVEQTATPVATEAETTQTVEQEDFNIPEFDNEPLEQDPPVPESEYDPNMKEGVEIQTEAINIEDLPEYAKTKQTLEQITGVVKAKKLHAQWRSIVGKKAIDPYDQVALQIARKFYSDFRVEYEKIRDSGNDLTPDKSRKLDEAIENVSAINTALIRFGSDWGRQGRMMQDAERTVTIEGWSAEFEKRTGRQPTRQEQAAVEKTIELSKEATEGLATEKEAITKNLEDATVKEADSVVKERKRRVLTPEQIAERQRLLDDKKMDKRDANIDDKLGKIGELTANIEELARTYEEKKKTDELTEEEASFLASLKDQIDKLKRVEKQQDRVIDLVEILRDGELAYDAWTAKNKGRASKYDPEGYAQMASNLMGEIRQTEWFKARQEALSEIRKRENEAEMSNVEKQRTILFDLVATGKATPRQIQHQIGKIYTARAMNAETGRALIDSVIDDATTIAKLTREQALRSVYGKFATTEYKLSEVSQIKTEGRKIAKMLDEAEKLTGGEIDGKTVKELRTTLKFLTSAMFTKTLSATAQMRVAQRVSELQAQLDTISTVLDKSGNQQTIKTKMQEMASSLASALNLRNEYLDIANQIETGNFKSDYKAPDNREVSPEEALYKGLLQQAKDERNKQLKEATKDADFELNEANKFELLGQRIREFEKALNEDFHFVSSRVEITSSRIKTSQSLLAQIKAEIRLTDRLTDLTTQNNTDAFYSKIRGSKAYEYTPAMLALEAKITEAERIRRHIIDASTPKTGIDKIQNVADKMRAGVMTLDQSVALVQLLRLAITNPIMWAKVNADGFKAMFSKDFVTASSAAMKAHPLYTDYIEAGAHWIDEDISSLAGEMKQYNEMKWTAPFNRSMGTALNSARFGMYVSAVETGIFNSIDSRKQLVSAIEISTGRGRSLFNEKGNQISSMALTSARMLTAAIEDPFLALTHSDEATKRWIVKHQSKSILGMAMIYFLAAMALGEENVPLDPTDKNFLRFRIGDRWVNPLGRHLPMTRFLMRLVYKTGSDSARFLDANGVDVGFILPENKYKWNMIAEGNMFFNGRLSPFLGAARGMITGTDWRNKETPRAEIALKSFTPITIVNIMDSFGDDDEHPAMKILFSAYGFWGGSSYKEEDNK